MKSMPNSHRTIRTNAKRHHPLADIQFLFRTFCELLVCSIYLPESHSLLVVPGEDDHDAVIAMPDRASDLGHDEEQLVLDIGCIWESSGCDKAH